jgi:hypothetical protein
VPVAREDPPGRAFRLSGQFRQAAEVHQACVDADDVLQRIGAPVDRDLARDASVGDPEPQGDLGKAPLRQHEIGRAHRIEPVAHQEQRGFCRDAAEQHHVTRRRAALMPARR